MCRHKANKSAKTYQTIASLQLKYQVGVLKLLQKCCDGLAGPGRLDIWHLSARNSRPPDWLIELLSLLHQLMLDRE